MHNEPPFPIRRPGALLNARFQDGSSWDELEFLVDFYNAQDVLQTKAFRVGVPDGSSPTICVPSTFDLNAISEEEIRAHLRMGSWLSGIVPNTVEWRASFIEGESQNFQMSIGTVKVYSVQVLSDEVLEISLRKGTSGPIRAVQFDYMELDIRGYQYDPPTQLAILAGSIAKALAHTHTEGTPLNQTKKDAIIAYVQGLAIFI